MPYEVKTVANPKEYSMVLEGFVPTLFIGVGGTGKDVVMRLRKRLYDKDGPGQRPYLRYLMLDMDSDPWWPSGASKEEYGPVQPQPGESISCRINEDQFYQVFDLLERERDPKFASWLKPSLRSLGPRAVQSGAGTQRQFGRMAFMLNYDKIRQRIDRHLRGMLDEVGRLGTYNAPDAKIESDTAEVVVVTSLAGGAGSGMFIDTAYLAKDVFRSHPQLANLRTQYVTVIAVMPTAFERVAEGRSYKKFQQNAYGALREMEQYGTRRTGDAMFLGEMLEKEKDQNRVGFVAPWKDNQFIEGHGWDICYLIDNVNPDRPDAPLSLSETYQMITDFLFLDFSQTEFAAQKRSNRCNLRQSQDDMICTWVRDPGVAEDQSSLSLEQTDDVVFATRSGCGFSSFGLSEVSFSRERVYSAASYLLASRLVRERWLGSQDDYHSSDYRKWVGEDFYCDTGDLSFHPDALLPLLYRSDKTDWYEESLTDCNKLEDLPFAEGSARLHAVQARHQSRLQSSPQPGPAYQTLVENAKKLADVTHGLPALHELLGQAACRRANTVGVGPTRELLNYYLATAQSVTRALREFPVGSKEAMLRLREADSLWPPARRIAQKIEFPRACAATREGILGSYRSTATAPVKRIMQKIVEYVGDKSQQIPPELTRHGTLYDYLARSEEQLQQLRHRLVELFHDYAQEQGTDRSQRLSPKTWSDETYSKRIDQALAAHSRIGGESSEGRFNWAGFEQEFFAELRAYRPHEFDKGFNTLTALLDRWFEQQMTDDRAIWNIAETLATACRSPLARGGLDFEDAYDGCVIDMLQLERSREERTYGLEKLIRSSTPYLPMVSEAAIRNNYSPQTDNLIGLCEGNIPGTSAQNKQQLLQEIAGISQQFQADLGASTPLTGDKSSLVLCREVWGVPLQYDAYLDMLHEAYFEREGAVDECHINSYECFDLPDVRAISPETYEHISTNVETVIFSMIIGTIAPGQDGSYLVKIPSRITGGVDTYRLGKGISRVIQKACEEERIRDYVQMNRMKWESEASPKMLAMVYASTSCTYEFMGREYRQGPEDAISPLRNLSGALLKRVGRQLSVSEEGQEWCQYLTCTNPTDPAADQQWKTLYEDLIDKKRVLFRASEAIPIWEIDWSKIDQVQLPDSAPQSGPAVEPWTDF